MLDQRLIDHNIQHAAQAIQRARATPSPWVWHVENVFSQDLVEKLHDYLMDEHNAIAWQPVAGQEHLNRRKVSWAADTVIEEIHMICDALTAAVADKFCADSKNFLGISVWKDWRDYTMKLHTDNPVIDVSMQLYLFDSAPPQAGTLFMIDHQPYLIPYHSNSGYICVLPTNAPAVSHMPATVTAADQVRYSLYSVWSKSTKHATDA